MTDKPPPRWFKVIVYTDLFLLRRVFMPVSHWIDWRFHINQYDQGAVVLSAGLALNLAANVQSLFGPLAWAGALGCFSSVVLMLVYRHWLKYLTIASHKYEKHPDRIYKEQAFFMILLVPPMRLMMVMMGTALMVPTPSENIVRMVTNPWLTVMGCGLYLAGGFPPTRPRKEKRVWAWSLHRFATTPTGP